MEEIVEFFCLFASEASADGASLGWENSQRLDRIAEHLRSWPRPYTVVVAGTASGYVPLTHYATLVHDGLVARGIPHERIVITGESASTASEIDAFEAFLQAQECVDCVLAASTVDHVRRVRQLWRIRHNRTVEGLPLAMPRTWYIRKRAALEIAKTAFLYAPAWLQDVCGALMRRLHLI